MTSNGRFVWYELLTTDPAAAPDFYRGVIGWGTKAWEGAGEPYTMWTNGEQPIGGMMQLPQEAVQAGAPPHWLAYVGVADVDAIAARATALGGCVLVAPRDIPGAGRFAVLQDPQGATIAVYHSEQAWEPPAEVPVGGVSWHELATSDHQAALSFYADLFGWEPMEAHDMGQLGVYQIFGHGGRPLGGMFAAPPGMPTSWLCYLQTDGIDRAVERVAVHGGQVLNGPMEVPGGSWIAQCQDPQGAMFALHAMQRE